MSAIERAVAAVIEDVQAKLAEYPGWGYDEQSWTIFVGNQMQRILEAIEADDDRRRLNDGGRNDRG